MTNHPLNPNPVNTPKPCGNTNGTLTCTKPIGHHGAHMRHDSDAMADVAKRWHPMFESEQLACTTRHHADPLRCMLVLEHEGPHAAFSYRKQGIVAWTQPAEVAKGALVTAIVDIGAGLARIDMSGEIDAEQARELGAELIEWADRLAVQDFTDRLKAAVAARATDPAPDDGGLTLPDPEPHTPGKPRVLIGVADAERLLYAWAIAAGYGMVDPDDVLVMAGAIALLLEAEPDNPDGWQKVTCAESEQIRQRHQLTVGAASSGYPYNPQIERFTEWWSIETERPILRDYIELDQDHKPTGKPCSHYVATRD